MRAFVVIAAFGLLALALPAGASAGHLPWSPLAGYWPLNEGRGQVAHDWSGHGNHGQLGSTPGVDSSDPTWIRGFWWLSKGLSFDGGDFVVIPDSDALEPQRITVESWFRRAGSPGKHRYLVSKGGDGCQAGSYGLYTSENTGLAFYVYDGSDYRRSPEATPDIWDGRWHHAAGTFDGSVVRLFVDGRQVGTGTPAGSSILYDLPVQDGAIGAYRASCSFLFEGDIDGVRVWSRALPVDTIWDKAREVLAELRH
jgi:Concanavalin A-like lectin/glucanases superfamily